MPSGLPEALIEFAMVAPGRDEVCDREQPFPGCLGYAIFDVDPGRRPGETTITMQYFAIPAVTNEAGNRPVASWVGRRPIGSRSCLSP
ncbi:MAG TPA: hypothetical protein VMC03_00425 [Streptosporangiaceae bacterium]|nr:hypothetical protein [Streptosporangiaceae bacterium]